jgi:hypothetical protein
MAFPIMLAFIAGLCMNGSAKKRNDYFYHSNFCMGPFSWICNLEKNIMIFLFQINNQDLPQVKSERAAACLF